MSQVTVATDNPAGKKLAKLQKKLQQIQELKERHANGERLEENQVNKWLTSMLGIPVHEHSTISFMLIAVKQTTSSCTGNAHAVTHSEYFTDAESNKWSQFAIYTMLDAYAATFVNRFDLD